MAPALLLVFAESARAANPLPCTAATGPCVVTRDVRLVGNVTADLGRRPLTLVRGTTVTVAVGGFTLVAGDVTLEPGARIVVEGDGIRGGQLLVQASGTLRVLAEPDGRRPAALITTADVVGGLIQATAAGDVAVAGTVDARSSVAGGTGGAVSLVSTAGAMTVGATASVTARGGAQGSGGVVSLLAARNLTFDGTIDAAGGDGGEVDLDAGGELATGAASRIDTQALATSGAAGTVAIEATEALTLRGFVDGRASGNVTDGGQSSASVDVRSIAGSVTLANVVDVTGPAPDGEGGMVAVEAGLDVVHTGSILAGAKGDEGCGGAVTLSAGRDLVIGTTDVTGGECGAGDYQATAARHLTATPGAVVNVDSGGLAGTIDVSAETISGVLDLHANGGAGGACGLLLADACTIDLAPGARLAASGRAIVATVSQGTHLRANGQLTVGGVVLGCPRADGSVLSHGNPLLPPIVRPGATLVPAPSVVFEPGLPICGAPPATTSSTVTTTSATTTTTRSTTTTTTRPPTSTTTTTVTLPASTTVRGTTTTATVPTTLPPQTDCPLVLPTGCDEAQSCDPPVGFAVAACRIALVAADVERAPADLFGGLRWRERLLHRIENAARLLETGRLQTDPRGAQRTLQRATRQIRGIGKVLALAVRRGKVDASAATPLIALAEITEAQLTRARLSLPPPG